MARIEQLIIRNYKVLADIQLGQPNRKDQAAVKLNQLTVFLGPNGVGKSTLFDVFGFLAQCLQTNVSDALAQRGGFNEVHSRQKTGGLQFSIKYRDQADDPLMTYDLHIKESHGRPIVALERLSWRRGKTGQPFIFLNFEYGKGTAVTGEIESDDRRTEQQVDRPDILAIKGLGQLATYPRIASLRRFIEGWFLSYFVPNRARELPDLGYAEHISREGDNLSNYTRYLRDYHPERFRAILEQLSRRIPRLEEVDALQTADGRVVLQFKDKPFSQPFISRFVSDGTLKMFAYLALLNDPNPPPLLCIEEPENGLHPQLLQVLVEEFRQHSQHTQVFISSHSPLLVNYLKPDELWLLDRDSQGYTKILLASTSQGVEAFLAEGLPLGDLWLANHLDGGTLNASS
jgi:predicted ATPase